MWEATMAYWDNPTPENDKAATVHLTFEFTREQYVAGLPADVAALIPAERWEEDWRVMNLPGRMATQRALIADFRHKFTTDPSVLVHDGTVYLYTGHDEAPVGSGEYVMHEWLCFSSRDLRTWVEHPIPLRSSDFSWARGDALITGQTTSATEAFVNIDPAVLVDDDGQAHVYWGKGPCYHARLDPSMTEPASDVDIVELPAFEEGAHLHRRGGWYYLSYGYGSPEKVAYAMTRRITGPWEFRAILAELAGNCETNRPAIVDFNGVSYFFCHNGGLPTGGSHRRSVCIDRLHYNADGSMKRVVMTSEGV
jgi:hypothetical protein